jgi:ATP adenylyltransferase
MKQLWAPWRMKYIKHAAEETGCIFCQKPRKKDDAKNLIFYRGKKSFALLNLYPYNSGHFMVAPYQHTAKLEKLSSETIAEIFKIINIGKKLLDRKIKPEGYNIGMNMGRVSGAGIADHLHMHVVPRWNGDTNFMPVLDDTKVMPQSLEETYEMMAKTSKLSL